MRKTGIGLYGENGHQVSSKLVNHPAADLVAVAGFGDVALPGGVGDVRRYDSLDAMLSDRDVELVSLCSPFRSEQAAQSIACMKADKHVYAEKPCALTEDDLDAIMVTARETGMQFHEMAGTVVDQPYMAMREVVSSGAVGEVVQVLAQKSYPWHDRRPPDERIDGGLAMQVGIYIGRFVEHIAGQRIASICLEETRLGNPVPGSDCRRAASFLMTLENGGVASAICNYLNPMQQRVWGYEIVRVFGTEGMVESSSEGPTLRLVRLGEQPEDVDLTAPSKHYFDLFVDALQGKGDMPLSMEDELRPTRWVIRAKNAASRGQTA